MREFTMKDAYSLDADAAGLDRFYPRMVAAYARIFERAGVPALAVEADSGAMGGGVSHEFMFVHEAGEDSFARCDACGYAANLEAAEFALPAPPEVPLQPVQKVATPDCMTIRQWRTSWACRPARRSRRSSSCRRAHPRRSASSSP